MYLPRTSVFHNRVDNRHRDVEAELQKTKDGVNTLMKVVAFIAVLGVLIMCGVAGTVAQSMTNQRNSENKDDALALSLENQHVTLQEQQNNTEKQLEAFGDMMRTIESKLQASVEHQHMSDIDIRLKILNATVQTVHDTIDAVQEQQNASETRLETLNDTVQTVHDTIDAVQKQQNTSETRLETLNDTVQTVHDTIDAVQEQQNESDKALSDYRTSIDRKLMEYNHTVQAVQERQTVSDQQVAFTVHGPTGNSVNTVLTFRNVYLNLGGGYNQTTGRFKCPVNGTYMFSATLVSVRNRSAWTWCYIRKNSDEVALVYSFEGRDDSASVSALVHLAVGNYVDLGSCYNVQNIYTTILPQTGYHTSFTGSLIQAD